MASGLGGLGSNELPTANVVDVQKNTKKLYHSSRIRLIRRPINKEGWNSRKNK
jgi:hypothetical protein